MDPLDALPPHPVGPPMPAPPARVQRADRDEQHLPPRDGKSPKGRDHGDENEAEDDLEEFFEPRDTRPTSNPVIDRGIVDRPGLGPHIDIIA